MGKTYGQVRPGMIASFEPGWKAMVRSSTGARLAVVLALCLTLLTTADAHAQGTVFRVGQIQIDHARGSAGLVEPGQLMSARASFGRAAGGVLTAASDSLPTEVVVLNEFRSDRVRNVDTGGVRAILEAIRQEVVNRTGTFAYVVPDQSQIMLRGEGEDYRGGGTDLRVLVYTSTRRVATPVTPPAPEPVPERPAAEETPPPAPREAAPSRPAPTRPAESRPAPRSEPARAQPAQPATRPAEQQPQAMPARETAPAADPTPPAQTAPSAEPAPAAQPASASEPMAVAEPAAQATEDGATVADEPAPTSSRRRVLRPRSAPVRVVSPNDLPVSQIELDPSMDGEPLPMTGFAIEYAREHPDMPPVEALNEVPVRLIRVADGFIAREGEGGWVRLGDLGADGSVDLYGSAIYEAMRSIVRWFNDRSVVGVLVAVDPDRGLDRELNGDFFDYRDDPDMPGLTEIPLTIFSTRVVEVSSIASGDRIKTEDRLNSGKHARIRAGSPIGPWDGSGERRDMIRFEPLNRYAFNLSRHPGRQVDVAIANASDPEDPETQGDAEVQYLVQEIKPWTAYFQLSNTGTEETDEWRQRFGFVHNQLLGFDDILTVDYITSNFRESHAFIGSYNFPLTPDGRLRWIANGEWTKYIASDVGVANQTFRGRSYAIGSELVFNFYQNNDLFIDWYGGGRYQDIEVINEDADLIGEEEVFVAESGFRVERRRPEVSFGGEVGLSWSINNLTGADAAELEELGRPGPDEEWMALVFNGDLSFYLDGIASWNKQPPALVHEIGLRLSGQYAFNDRLIPNYQAIGGGLYTVRGYDESVVAGDNAVIGSVEYRLHIPRALGPGEPIAGGRFRVVPDGEGGLPDWDLIFKAFLDAGRVTVNRAFNFENDESLLSTGVGLELVIANNLSFRTDWGIVLDAVGSNSPDPTDVGDSRFHFVLTVLY